VGLDLLDVTDLSLDALDAGPRRAALEGMRCPARSRVRVSRQ
jgi:hypothetical protein